MRWFIDDICLVSYLWYRGWPMKRQLLLSPLLCLWACSTGELGTIQTAHLLDQDAKGFAEVKAVYEAHNPGATVDWYPDRTSLTPSTTDRVLFVHGEDQQGRATAVLTAPDHSELSVGDLILLRRGQVLRTDTPVNLLAFGVGERLPSTLPTVIRPDNDPLISDTPGGCATDADAYRRVALTWLAEKGPYVFHGINAHRVLITDSFTHYHPVDTGWDEFYLVQATRPGSGIYTSRLTDQIESPDQVELDEVDALLQWNPVEPGDLVLLPRGTVHRGFGGVLVHVLAVPGFVPDNEIGVDDQLRSINDRLGLTGENALPCHNCEH